MHKLILPNMDADRNSLRVNLLDHHLGIFRILVHLPGTQDGPISLI